MSAITDFFKTMPGDLIKDVGTYFLMHNVMGSKPPRVSVDPDHRNDRFDERSMQGFRVRFEKKQPTLYPALDKFLDACVNGDWRDAALFVLEAVTETAEFLQATQGDANSKKYMLIREVTETTVTTGTKTEGKGKDAKQVPDPKKSEKTSKILVPNFNEDEIYAPLIEDVATAINNHGGAAADPQVLIRYFAQNGFISRSKVDEWLRNLKVRRANGTLFTGFANGLAGFRTRAQTTRDTARSAAERQLASQPLDIPDFLKP
jgi:hypothetical protein